MFNSIASGINKHSKRHKPIMAIVDMVDVVGMLMIGIDTARVRATNYLLDMVIS